MFIDTLEFTIPVELCSMFSTLQKGPRSNVEFPASVNSYGTTQDANVQVVLRSNKVTFKVEGVSSNSSMICKSECKTLKLSVFDVDCSLMPQEEDTYDNMNSNIPHSLPSSHSLKRLHEHSSYQSAKSSRTSYSDSPRPRSPPHRRSQPHASPRPIENSKSQNNNAVNVKQEPEDPDLIEIEPDPEPDDVVPKKETPYMQIDYSSNLPHTQTSRPQSSASSSSSFHQNVPHVPDYAEPGPSRRSHPGDQSADDYLVFQDDNEDCDDNDAEYANDDSDALAGYYDVGRQNRNMSETQLHSSVPQGGSPQTYPCPHCYKIFTNHSAKIFHVESIHEDYQEFLEERETKTDELSSNQSQPISYCYSYVRSSSGLSDAAVYTYRKRIVKPLETKYFTLLEVEKGLKSKSQIAREVGVPANTLSTWLKHSNTIKNNYRRYLNSQNPGVEVDIADEATLPQQD